MNITDLIQSQLSGDVLNQLTKQIGAKDSKQTALAASGIVDLLVGAIAQNAATPQGAESLAKALDRDHDGSILGNVMGMLGGQAGNNKAVNGAGILGHILGSRQSGAVEAVSKASGLNANQVSSLMVALAPIIMSALGKTKKDGKLDTSDLVGMLGQVMSGITQKGKGKKDPKMAAITSFLDRNRDAKASDDIFNLGKKFISNIIGKK